MIDFHRAASFEHRGDGGGRAVEEEALRLGLSLGMTSIDTSGDYGGGRSEELIGRAVAGRRDSVFLVSKVESDEVTGDSMARACAASLARLATDHLDLYLLHWPVPNSRFAGVVAAFERLRAAGKIRAWGVSNFNVRQMETLVRVPDGHRCATNQVPYSLNDRRIERDLLLWLCRSIWGLGHSPAVRKLMGSTGSGAAFILSSFRSRLASALIACAIGIAEQLAWSILLATTTCLLAAWTSRRLLAHEPDM